MTKEEFIAKLILASKQTDKPYLTRNFFASFLQVSTNKVQRLTEKFFDKWSDACSEAGVKSGPNDARLLTPNIGFTEEQCKNEITRVANLLNKKNISQEEFKIHSKMHPITLVRKFNSWEEAMSQAGLYVGKGYNKTITDDEIADDFKNVILQIEKIPTISQMVNRGKFSRGTYETKYGTYSKYKIAASQFVLNLNLIEDVEIVEAIKKLFSEKKSTSNQIEIRPHFKGHTLGFRSFAFAPTYEQEVVAMFGTIAQEIGFEIITIREEFPDCKARRKLRGKRNRYKECLIEFELNASDFIKHKHPVDGCDLIICWENDLDDFPLEIIELKKVIKRLDGWK